MEESKIFQKGQNVLEDGKYVCVPCGYQHEYKAGDKFGECTSCLNKKKELEEDEILEDIEGTGMWEKKDENI